MGQRTCCGRDVTWRGCGRRYRVVSSGDCDGASGLTGGIRGGAGDGHVGLPRRGDVRASEDGTGQA
ncbi:hypothetical protein E2562_001304 [Oryza meyeriana var. granulata]|uniref:Uncharacterized protein n=1 Tax=Oryza meyeriana var. granulata TaxID=110450 RepID=A0A6G1DBH8_9ORYZ|nr:hypothetical protein E2562_001304 [Oryza meyeriana var. granulata]